MRTAAREPACQVTCRRRLLRRAAVYDADHKVNVQVGPR